MWKTVCSACKQWSRSLQPILCSQYSDIPAPFSVSPLQEAILFSGRVGDGVNFVISHVADRNQALSIWVFNLTLFSPFSLLLPKASKEHLEEHYIDLKGKPFFNGLIKYMSSGPVVAMVSLHPVYDLDTSCIITSSVGIGLGFCNYCFQLAVVVRKHWNVLATAARHPKVSTVRNWCKRPLMETFAAKWFYCFDF